MTTSLPLDEELAQALIASASQVFQKALNLNVSAQPWSLIDAPLKGDYSGFVYLVDIKEKKHVATMGISFMDPVIRYILQSIYGNQVNQRNSAANEILRDGISEITNIIYTGVKSRLNDKGYSFILSLPVIVEGKDHLINRNSVGKSLRVPFLTNNYEFFIDASIDLTEGAITPEKWKNLGISSPE
jgi:CheY-specific phosphatase CheX